MTRRAASSACSRCRARSPRTSSGSLTLGVDTAPGPHARRPRRRRRAGDAGRREHDDVEAARRRAGCSTPLERAARATGMAVFGTCAGMILLATDVLDGRPDQRSFGAIDIAVRRNGYGRQVDSFEADLDDRRARSTPPFHGVFIRAPKVESRRRRRRGARRPRGRPGARCGRARYRGLVPSRADRRPPPPRPVRRADLST